MMEVRTVLMKLVIMLVDLNGQRLVQLFPIVSRARIEICNILPVIDPLNIFVIGNFKETIYQ